MPNTNGEFFFLTLGEVNAVEEWFFLGKIIFGAILFLLVLNELLLKCYVSAQTEKGALRMMAVLHLLGFGIISDALGEKVPDKKTANRRTARIVLHIKRMAALRKKYPNIRLAIAVKPTMIGLKVDKALTRRNFKKIYGASQKYDIRLEIDMEGPETINDTLDVIRSLLRLGNQFRQAIQANQTKSWRALNICGQLHIAVRLVKGAYPGDIEDPEEINRQYVHLATIAKKFDLNTAYGTHDFKLFEKVQAIHKGTVQKLFGIQMLGTDDIYLPWGRRREAWKFIFRRVKEGVRPNVLFMFLRNIPESLWWRLRYAPLSFFY